MAGTKNHDFHILDPDYMPFLGSVSALTMTSGGVMAMHPEWAGGIGKYVLLLGFAGVLLTMFDGRTNLAIQVAQEVKRFCPGKVYATVIPRNIRLSEAPSHGKPITAYDRGCRGAEAYLALANEFLKKNT